MPYSTNPHDYDEDELRQVAELFFVDQKTHAAIGALRNIPRTKVAAMCEAARTFGLVRIAIMPSPYSHGERLRAIAAKVREKFNLLDCVIVNARQEVLGERAMTTDQAARIASIRENVVDSLSHKAAAELERRFKEATDPCMAVVYGFVARKVADNLQSTTIKRDGIILAAQGVRRNEMDRFDANDIARDIARQFGCRYACMPIPAVVNKEVRDVVVELDLVKEVLGKLSKSTNIVFSSLGSIHEGDRQRAEGAYMPTIDSLGMDLKPNIEVISQMGGIGNIGGWWFNSEGNAVDDGEHAVIGLGLKRMKELVKEGKPVILAVGADPARIPALATVLQHKIANIWVGDEVTARVLLGVEPVETKEVKWGENEKEILQKLAEIKIPL